MRPIRSFAPCPEGLSPLPALVLPQGTGLDASGEYNVVSFPPEEYGTITAEDLGPAYYADPSVTVSGAAAPVDSEPLPFVVGPGIAPW